MNDRAIASAAPFVVALFVVALLASCDAGRHRGNSDNQHEAAAVSRGVDLMPLEAGTILLYEGHEDGVPLLEEVEIMDSVAWPAGPGAPQGGHADRAQTDDARSGHDCTPVVERRFVGGQLVEVTTEWFAAANDGSIWQFGEESWERHGSGFALASDSWRAYQDQALPIEYLPALLRAGDEFEQILPHGTERLLMASSAAVAETPAGRFEGCAELHENPGTKDLDIVLYRPGVGIVQLTGTRSRKVLVRRSRR